MSGPRSFAWLLLTVALSLASGVGAGEVPAPAPTPEAESAYLGVRLSDEAEDAQRGARVSEIVPGSPAAAAGIEPGDVVIAFDGDAIDGPAELTEKIQAHAPGHEVSITVRRGETEKTFRLELASRLRALGFYAVPEERWRERQDDVRQRLQELGRRLGDEHADPDVWRLVDPETPRPFVLWERPRLGVQLVETTPELRRHLGGDEERGVLVSKVLAGTPAARAGLAVGDLILAVDGVAVATSDALVEALGDKVGKTFSIEVVRDRERVKIAVTIPDPDADRPTGPRA